MKPPDLHSPEFAELIARVKKLEDTLLVKEMALEDYKKNYIELLNEVTPAGTETQRTNFMLEPKYREFLGSVDPQNKNNMTRGLKFLLDLAMLEES